ncbi:uncharacterized protein prage isoform X3 [Bemisia tabaci]|uniref:uncharacterized protein prage isoform X3 n=1 Tax=Bemisia tabaci TaxID=7038 RepID=UPI003B28D19C
MCNYSEEETPVKTVKEKTILTNTPTRRSVRKKQTKKWNHDFDHTWLIRSIKGHSDSVLNMDFSSNGKFLASCSEADPGGDESATSSGSEGNKENTGYVSEPKQLTRRQRKNRVKSKDSPKTAKASPKAVPTRSKQPVSKYRSRLHCDDDRLFDIMRKYTLHPDQLLSLGFPVESTLYPGRAIFFKQPNLSGPSLSPSSFDVNASEFVPKSLKLIRDDDSNYKNMDDMSSTLRSNASEFVPRSIFKRGDLSECKETRLQAPHPHNDSERDRDRSPVVVPSKMLETSTATPRSDYSSAVLRSSAEIDRNRLSSAASEFVPRSCSEATLSSNASEFVPRGLYSSCFLNKNQSYSRADDESKLSSTASEFVPKCSFSNVLKNSSETENMLNNAYSIRRAFNVNSEEKKCVRCGKGFFVTPSGEYLTEEHCIYHWGKLFRPLSGGEPTHYACCNAHRDSKGCSTGKLHVWNGIQAGVNGPFEGYVRTRPSKSGTPNKNRGLYALDCEMCYTIKGLELTKVTLVNSNGHRVYDCLVRPQNHIIDYNTRYSGLTEKDFTRKNIVVKPLKKVQKDLLNIINAESILIGHSLDNDLRALRIIHSRIIDTSIVFPHAFGLPFRRSLKSLVKIYLKQNIQNEESGHDSFEDARSCIDLILYKIRCDFGSLSEPSP